jgi:hypothetical protein
LTFFFLFIQNIFGFTNIFWSSKYKRHFGTGRGQGGMDHNIT